jgi:hypothetical protein
MNVREMSGNSWLPDRLEASQGLSFMELVQSRGTGRNRPSQAVQVHIVITLQSYFQESWIWIRYAIILIMQENSFGMNLIWHTHSGYRSQSRHWSWTVDLQNAPTFSSDQTQHWNQLRNLHETIKRDLQNNKKTKQDKWVNCIPDSLLHKLVCN